jgi:uncharacterized protein YecT (DUF1311 family)
MHRLALVATALLLSLASGHAQTPNPIDCGKAATTVEMNYCADRDYAEADRALNETYQKALAVIARSGGPAPYTPAQWEQELRASQRAWLAFRDADCKGLAPMEWSGGSGTASAVLGCMIDLTKARSKALLDRYGR